MTRPRPGRRSARDWTKIGAIIAAIALVPATIGIIPTVRGLWGADDAPASTTAATTSVLTTAASLDSAGGRTEKPTGGTSTVLGQNLTSQETPGPPAPGSCLDNRGVMVSCVGQHSSEVTSTDPTDCDTAGAQFIAADLDRDVLMTSFGSTATADGTDVCSVRDRAGATPRSLRDALNVLAEEASDLRLCRMDSSVTVDVPCSQAHTAEYVAMSKDIPASVETCSTAAAAYMSTGLERVSGSLKIVPAQEPRTSPLACAIQVRNANQVLTRSVRNIGSTTLPLSNR